MILFEVLYPANAVIYNSQLTSFITFELLKPENIVKIVFPDFSKTKIFNTFKETYLKETEEFSQVLILVTAGLLGTCMLSIAAAIPFSRNFAISKFRDWKTKFFFNGILRTILITQMNQCIVLGTIIEQAIIGEQELTSGQKLKGITMSFYIFTVIALPIYILTKRRLVLSHKEQEDKIGRLYNGLSLRSSSCGIYYFPMLLLRFFIFIMISSLFTL